MTSTKVDGNVTNNTHITAVNIDHSNQNIPNISAPLTNNQNYNPPFILMSNKTDHSGGTINIINKNLYDSLHSSSESGKNQIINDQL